MAANLMGIYLGKLAVFQKVQALALTSQLPVNFQWGDDGNTVRSMAAADRPRLHSRQPSNWKLEEWASFTDFEHLH